LAARAWDGLDLLPTKPYAIPMRASFLRFIPIPAAVGLLFLACSDPPPAKNPDDEELLPLKVSTAKPAPMDPPPADTPEAAPTATASAAASAPPVPQGSGRPPVLKMDPTEISDTFGVSPGAKLELGSDPEKAVMRIPEGAFETGVNVTFKLDPKGKTTGILIGKVYHLTAVIPPSGTPVRIVTVGGPFELQLPAGNKKDANLAIGEIGGGRVTWKVIAPKKIDDVAGIAYFEITELYDHYLHVTTKAVTAPATK
jgi:hypothetical protein